MTTYIKVTLIIYGVIIIGFWLYWKLREWREDRIFWKQLKIKLQKQDKEFYDGLFEELRKDQRFTDLMCELIGRKQANAIIEAINGGKDSDFTGPELDQKKLMNRIKQWIINIF